MPAFVPRQMLAFDWSLPPSIPSLRRGDARTQVAVFLEPLDAEHVRARFVQHGWGEGDDRAAPTAS